MSADDNLPLDVLASTIKAHIKKGDETLDKAEQHYIAAGIHLQKAKTRVLKTKGLTWPAFLVGHCNIQRARADELIAIANGEKSLEDVRERARKGMAETRERRRSTSDLLQRYSKSFGKTQQKQRPALSPPTQDERQEIIARIVACVSELDLEQLQGLELILKAEGFTYAANH